MRRKISTIITLAAVAVMTMTSLTGCGTKAEATNKEVPMEEETIIVTDDESSEDITDDEVITAGTDDTAGNETVGGDIIFYTELIGEFPDEPSQMFEFETIDEEVTVGDDVTVTAGGREVGYIESGTTIRLIEKNAFDTVFRVENSSGVGYEYVYITSDDLLTLDDMKELVAKHLRRELSTVLEELDTDMEYIEFTIEKSKRSGVEDYVCECLEDIQYEYDTFYVECTKNDKLVDVRVYYK